MQRIGRWASPDPLSVHAMEGGEAGNAYHYVSGNLLQARDPLGLEPCAWEGSADARQFGDAYMALVGMGVPPEQARVALNDSHLGRGGHDPNYVNAKLVTTAVVLAPVVTIPGAPAVLWAAHMSQVEKHDDLTLLDLAGPGPLSLLGGARSGLRVGLQHLENLGARMTLRASHVGLAREALSSERGVWSMRSLFTRAKQGYQSADRIRGYLVEEALGGNLPNNFKTIDRVVGNDFAPEAIHSIKSIDMSTKSAQKASSLRSTLKGHIDSLAKFSQESGGGRQIRAAPSTRRVLDVGVEAGAATEAQQAVLEEAAQYANSQGVQMVVHEVK